MRNGMGWLHIDFDMFLFLPQRLPQYSLQESSQKPVPLHTDVFEDSHGGKVTGHHCSPTAPLHHPHERHVLRFCHPLSAYLRPPLCPPLHVGSPQHLHFENNIRRTKVPRGVSASTADSCLNFLLYNASRCPNGRCRWCAGRNDRRILVESSGLLAKVLDQRQVTEIRMKLET